MQVNRTENKIIINTLEKARLERRLGMIMPLDPHCADGRSYSVRTLYFDTVTDRCIAEKEDGLLVHEKLRLRVYGNDENTIKLECKQKVDSLQTKKSMLVTREQCDRLIAGDLSWLLSSPDPLGAFFFYKLSRGYFPKAVIEYQRLAYSLNVNATRITFDFDIRACESDFQLFGDHLQTHPIFPPDKAVLEIKFNHYLPGYIKKALSDVQKSPGSFSKYTAGRYFYRNML